MATVTILARPERLVERDPQLHAEVQARQRDALKTFFLAGIAGVSVKLPYVVFGQAGRPNREAHQSIAEAAADALDFEEVMADLLMVLETVEHPKLRYLKVRMAEAYANYWSGPLADIEVPTTRGA